MMYAGGMGSQVRLCFFWLYLLFSGLLVNHSDMFGLYKHEIRCSWLSNWYEIPAAEPKEGYDLGKAYLSWDGDRWVLDDVLLSGSTGRPVERLKRGSIMLRLRPIFFYIIRMVNCLRSVKSNFYRGTRFWP